MVNHFVGRPKCTKKELLSLIGTFNFAARVVVWKIQEDGVCGLRKCRRERVKHGQPLRREAQMHEEGATKPYRNIQLCS